MMTRFSAAPRINYKPVERDKPGRQLIGLYNMWQSLSPETRKRIADWFSNKDNTETDATPTARLSWDDLGYESAPQGVFISEIPDLMGA